MKKRFFSLIFVLVLCLTVAVSMNVVKASASGSTETIGQLMVLDDAGLLTESEVNDLNTKLLNIGSTYHAQIAVITLSSMEGYDIDDVVNVLYDEMNLGYGDTRAGVLLLISMDPREYRILTNGMADEAIGDSGIDTISDYIVSDLSDGNYAAAFNGFADQCEYYLNGHLNGFPFEAGTNLLIALVIGIVVGVVVALILKGQLKSVRQKNDANVYVKPGSMNLTVSNDFFLYRTVDRRKKENNSGSSGSSGSSRSVGGGSF